MQTQEHLSHHIPATMFGFLGKSTSLAIGTNQQSMIFFNWVVLVRLWVIITQMAMRVGSEKSEVYPDFVGLENDVGVFFLICLITISSFQFAVISFF